MLDATKLPIPKFKVGDKAWILEYLSYKEVTIQTVLISGSWFDNEYTSRQDFEVTYEVTSWVSTYKEQDLYKSKRTVQRKLANQKIEIRQRDVKKLKDAKRQLDLDCKRLGLTIEDL